jgi:acyl carrier protein
MGEPSNGINKSIKEFILEAIAVPELDDDMDLFKSGIVNSLFAVQLIAFLEKTFGIEVTSDDLKIENFKSINATASFVIEKGQGAPA